MTLFPHERALFFPYLPASWAIDFSRWHDPRPEFVVKHGVTKRRGFLL